MIVFAKSTWLNQMLLFAEINFLSIVADSIFIMARNKQEKHGQV